MEPWKCPLVHPCLLQEQAPSPWNFHREGRLSAPDLGLASSNFPCDSRMAARLLMELSVWGCCAPSCASYPASALRCSSAAWRLEVAPLVRHDKVATQVSGKLCSQCSIWKLPHISVYQYQPHSFRGLPTSTRKLVGTVWGSRRCHPFS